MHDDESHLFIVFSSYAFICPVPIVNFYSLFLFSLTLVFFCVTEGHNGYAFDYIQYDYMTNKPESYSQGPGKLYRH